MVATSTKIYMQTTTSRVLADMELSGTLKFSGGMVFEGRFIGGRIEGDTLVVAAGAHVEANIVADDITLFGRVDGDVEATGRCQLRPSAELYGNLKTPRVGMDEGATFTGSMQIVKSGGK